jgi:hypothetical protein
VRLSRVAAGRVAASEVVSCGIAMTIASAGMNDLIGQCDGLLGSPVPPV